MAQTPPLNTVSGAVLGKLLNVAEPYLNRLATQGVVVRKAKGQFELWSSVRGYIKFLQSRIHERKTPDHTKSLAMEKIRKTREEADRVAMENQKGRGLLVSTDEIMKAFGGVFAGARDVILASTNLDDTEKEVLLTQFCGLLDREALKHERNSNGAPGVQDVPSDPPEDNLPGVG